MFFNVLACVVVECPAPATSGKGFCKKLQSLLFYPSFYCFISGLYWGYSTKRKILNIYLFPFFYNDLLCNY